MKIMKLTARNVKRVRAVEITPDGNLVVISGRNGQGKTSVLDSIAYALAGKEAICTEPVRRGTSGAEVVCDLGEIVVRRTLTPEGGGSLVVETKDGARLKAPQTRLDDLIGRLSFDPIEFDRMKPPQQAEVLRDLVGLDLSPIQGERDQAYAKRTEINRDAKSLEARLEASPGPWPDVPETEVPAEALLAKLDRALASGRAFDEAHAALERAASERSQASSRVAQIEEEIALLQTKLANAKEDLRARELELGRRQDAAVEANSAVIDRGPIREELKQLEQLNQKVRENAARRSLEAALLERKVHSSELTSLLDSIEARRLSAIASAKFPVPGLGFDPSGGVTFNGLPYDQASGAERLRVSVAMGIAMNPKLRVLLIRDGSLLDQDSLRLVAELAAENEAQVWIERIEEGGATVIIEDGSALPPRPAMASDRAGSAI